MIELNLTAALLISISGAVLSAAFTWFPKLNTWYVVLEKDKKSAIMLGTLITSTVVIVSLGCLNVISVTGLVCNPQGLTNVALNLAIGLVGAMQANQGVYGLTKNLAPAKVKALRSVQG
jgi:hypothetical protein